MKILNSLFYLGCLLFNLGIALPAIAVDSRSALIIGISTYENPTTQALPGVLNDIQSAKLIAQKMGAPDVNIKILRDSEATKQNILKELSLLSDLSNEGVRTFIYFSGYGTRYLDAAVGGCVEALLSFNHETITNQELAKATQRLVGKSDKTLFMIDASFTLGVTNSKNVMQILGEHNLAPKFTFDTRTGLNLCAQQSVQRSQSLVLEAIKLGALQQNIVQITASRADESSFDELQKGGIATQAFRDCLLGDAKDLDNSGAVALVEIQKCTQDSINKKLINIAGVRAQNLVVLGGRNLILTPIYQTAPILDEMQIKPEVQKNDFRFSDSHELLMPLATLRDIEAQSNAKRKIDLKLRQSLIKIGRDTLELVIRSSHSGYVHLIHLESDAKSFKVLFPNSLDSENKIRAGQILKIPRTEWAVTAASSLGTSHLLVIVTDTPRKLSKANEFAPNADQPFTTISTDLSGRVKLLDLFLGKGAQGDSEIFVAKIVPFNIVK